MEIEIDSNISGAEGEVLSIESETERKPGYVNQMYDYNSGSVGDGGDQAASHRATMAIKRQKLRKVLIELYNLKEDSSNSQRHWTEVGRFEKYEKFITSDLYWCQPKVPFLTFHSLVQLRSSLVKGVLMFDLYAANFKRATNIMATTMAQKFRTNHARMEKILEEIGLAKSDNASGEKDGIAEMSFDSSANSAQDYETAQVFAAAMDEIDKHHFAMIRFSETLNKESAHVRFLFILLGPHNDEIDYKEIGRSICTLMTNPSFQEIAYRATDRSDLTSAVDLFLAGCVIIAPCDIRNKQLIAPEQIQKALKKRQSTLQFESLADSDPLERSGKLFGGLRANFKTLQNRYKSDFTDGFRFRTLASIIFIFFANFSVAITFGGLFGAYTNDEIGTFETLLSQCICGVIWGLCSAQPLLILSATGPVLIFESSLFLLCQQLGLEFLTIRLWTGVWFFLITIVAVAFEAASLLHYVTRFTQEIFSTLIAAIFIKESINFLIKTFKVNPVEDLMHYWYNWEICVNDTGKFSINTDLQTHLDYWIEKRSNLGHFTFLDKDERLCFDKNQPDTALISTVLLFSTFVMAYFMKKLRSSYVLGRTLRQAIGDLGLLIPISVCAFWDHVIFDKLYLQRLDMPITFGFTLPVKRHWSFIAFLLPSTQWWTCLLAIFPGFLVFVLIFVESGVTELELLEKKRCLIKGSGIHWDLLLIGFLILLCSIFGLPWMCGSAAQSLAHCSSLSIMRPHAPGEKPLIDHVIEQRLTALAVSIMLGLCAFAGALLRFMPFAVLFGVFLYLGIVELMGMEFTHRLFLLFVPSKYFPNSTYCQEVKPQKIHLYTLIQIVCVCVVYTMKEIKSTAMLFPMVQVLACILRQKILPLIFSHKELEGLDGEQDDEEYLD